MKREFEDAERNLSGHHITERQPSVEKIKEEAPDKTSMIWNTSDPEKVTVMAKCMVTAVAAQMQ